MTTVYGIASDEARTYVGSAWQLARVDSFIEAEGAARGARRLRLITGGGLEVDLHPDRALDVGQVTVDGVPVSWMESEGIPHPWAVDPHGDEWLRSFGGGLVTTCGLDSFGPPTVDGGVAFGQHGRVSGTPARMTQVQVVDEQIVVEGIVRQSRLHGENLVLRRRITAPVGGRTFIIDDVVTNEASAAEPHMMMYHINVGWPMIDENATFQVPSSAVVPRDDVSAKGSSRLTQFERPLADRAEEVYVHHFDKGQDRVTAQVDNSRRGLRMAVTFDRSTLPWLDQWKFMREGAYVLGIEPVNSPSMKGRAGARADGELPVLQPGASVAYHIEIEFIRL